MWLGLGGDSLDQRADGGGERWLDGGYILNTELTGFLSEMAMGWEAKGGVKDDTKVLT